jgi:hypothetical protein
MLTGAPAQSSGFSAVDVQSAAKQHKDASRIPYFMPGRQLRNNCGCYLVSTSALSTDLLESTFSKLTRELNNTFQDYRVTIV